MRTNIELNEQIVKEAFRYVNVKTKRELVDLALRELIENHKKLDVRELVDKVKIDEHYNYKKLRR